MFKRKSADSSPKGPSKFNFGCTVMFLIPFFAVGIGTLGFGAWGAYQGLASKSWTKVSGTITQSGVEAHSGSKGGTTYGTKVHYTYEWGGKKLEGDRVQTSVPVSTSSGDGARETVARYAAGTKVDVFVNPVKPEQAVLETGLGWSHLFLPLFGLGFGGVAALILWMGIWGRRKQKAMEEKKAMVEAIAFGREAERGAEGMEWEALKSASSASSQDRKLRETKDGCFRVVPMPHMWVISLAFVLAGLGLMVGLGISVWMAKERDLFDWIKMVLMPFCSIFIVVGFGMIYEIMSGPIFDPMNQRCCRLRTGSKPFGDRLDVSFSEIKGLQLLVFTAHNKGEDDVDITYTAYQLNLVLKDKTRLNIMSHPNLPALEADAQTLAQLLRVPLWKRV